MKPYFPRKPISSNYKTNEAFECIKVYLPRETARFIKDKSEEIGVPMSRLVAICVDNERSAPSPFNYPCDLPTSPFIERAYADEASKLISFLSKFEYGTSLDTLMICRRDVGIESREVLMLAFRELIEVGIVEEFKPKRTQFAHPANYRRWRVIGTDPKDIRKMKHKPIEEIG